MGEIGYLSANLTERDRRGESLFWEIAQRCKKEQLPLLLRSAL